MKIKDLADGVTYNFRIRAKTLTYGPEVEANITTGPGEGGRLNILMFVSVKIYIGGHFFSLSTYFCPHKEPRALLESPLFLATAQLSLCIGPAAIKAAHQSHDTSSRPDPPVSHFTTLSGLLHDDYSFLRQRVHVFSSSCLSDEGLWDILIKDIPKEVTSYTLNLDMLREGVTYDFRVIAVNDYGYGSPSAPSPSISGTLNRATREIRMWRNTSVTVSANRATSSTDNLAK